MRLDFNVLWVDDQPTLLNAQVVAMSRVMAGEGFELRPSFCTGVDDVLAQLTDDIFRDEVDLILVDWDLGGGVEGQTVITQIRESIPYRDIVFYSANAEVAALREASFKEGHEGVYFVTRPQLVDEIAQLFRSAIKKVLDLDHTRGIVMGATSDVDQTARECLIIAHDMLDEAGRKGVLEEMLSLLDDKMKGSQKKLEKLKANPAVAAIIAEHGTFTANDGLRILTRLLDMPQFAAHKGHRDAITKYTQQVVPTRNILGHKVLTPEGKPGIAGETTAQVISLEEMRQLRGLLLELRAEFKGFHGALSASLPRDAPTGEVRAS